MKVLVLEREGVLAMKDAPKPAPRPGEALVKVRAVSVCGSDVHAFKGENPLLTYPRIMGHEVCGVIEEINSPDAKGLAAGDQVILIPYLACGSCIACRRGKPNCCRSLSVYGVHHDGAMAEYFTAPLAYLLKVDPEMDPVRAAVIEPFAISTHAVRRSGVELGETLLVLGAGPIGLGAAAIARTLGAHLILADTDEKRRAFAGERFAFPHILDPLAPGYRDRIMEMTGGWGPTRIIDSTGNGASMTGAIGLLANGGRLVYVGIYKGDLSFKHTVFHMPETELLGSRGAVREDFQYVIDCVESGAIDPKQFITHSAPFEKGAESLQEWVGLGGAVFKSVLTM